MNQKIIHKLFAAGVLVCMASVSQAQVVDGFRLDSKSTFEDIRMTDRQKRGIVGALIPTQDHPGYMIYRSENSESFRYGRAKEKNYQKEGKGSEYSVFDFDPEVVPTNGDKTAVGKLYHANRRDKEDVLPMPESFKIAQTHALYHGDDVVYEFAVELTVFHDESMENYITKNGIEVSRPENDSHTFFALDASGTYLYNSAGVAESYVLHAGSFVVDGVEYLVSYTLDLTGLTEYDAGFCSQLSKGGITSSCYGFMTEGTTLKEAKKGIWNSTEVEFHISITTVPEPEAYAMLLAGLGVIGVVARRRRNAFYN